MYLSLLDYEERGIDAEVAGLDVRYIGALPKKPSLLLCPLNYYSFNSGDSFYISSLEASLSSFSVITVVGERGCYAVKDGTFDGEGKLFIFTPLSLEDFKMKHAVFYRTAMITGGGVVTFKSYREAWQGALLSSNVFLTSGGSWGSGIISSALDMGLETAIFRSSLKSPMMRKMAKEGCPVVESFSSFLMLPKVIAYEDKEGKYGKKKRYGILRIES